MNPIRSVEDVQRSSDIGNKRLVYFSSVPYHSYAQRPHFMATAFTDAGYDAVLWIDPYTTRLPRLSDIGRRRGTKAPCTRLDDRIESHRPRALPIEPLPAGGLLNHVLCWSSVRRRLHEFAAGGHCVIGIGRPSDLALWALANLPHERSFADVLDNFPAFYRGISRLSMQRRLKKVCRAVTDVFCSSNQLAHDIQKIRADAVVILNGYPTDCLPLPSIRPVRPYVGYLGTIGEWFDWPLVCEIAKALPATRVRLIGPEFVPRPANLPANIEFLGERPFEDMKHFAQDFAVGLIPFKHNDLTESIDPIKFYEYRSMGIPIWSTPFGEMRSRGGNDGVVAIQRGLDWLALWDQACSYTVEMQSIIDFKEAVSWKKRFAPLLERVACLQ
ncbi:glycosyl transferase [Burkholderia plantarii]|uniref:Putative glycosyltransferase n=1 Tax=Burkholderia plantarii TaxID=41899 RepID=A0A0B6RNG6_BURPL|nr:glycosyl transferase [Burkholderia plantarii]AJK44893.1 putative glycosyltransferase [Burkholderia plantarii]